MRRAALGFGAPGPATGPPHPVAPFPVWPHPPQLLIARLWTTEKPGCPLLFHLPTPLPPPALTLSQTKKKQTGCLPYWINILPCCKSDRHPGAPPFS